MTEYNELEKEYKDLIMLHNLLKEDALITRFELWDSRLKESGYDDNSQQVIRGAMDIITKEIETRKDKFIKRRNELIEKRSTYIDMTKNADIEENRKAEILHDIADVSSELDNTDITLQMLQNTYAKSLNPSNKNKNNQPAKNDNNQINAEDKFFIKFSAQTNAYTVVDSDGKCSSFIADCVQAKNGLKVDKKLEYLKSKINETDYNVISNAMSPKVLNSFDPNLIVTIYSYLKRKGGTNGIEAVTTVLNYIKVLDGKMKKEDLPYEMEYDLCGMDKIAEIKGRKSKKLGIFDKARLKNLIMANEKAAKIIIDEKTNEKAAFNANISKIKWWKKAIAVVTAAFAGISAGSVISKQLAERNMQNDNLQKGGNSVGDVVKDNAEVTTQSQYNQLELKTDTQPTTVVSNVATTKDTPTTATTTTTAVTTASKDETAKATTAPTNKDDATTITTAVTTKDALKNTIESSTTTATTQSTQSTQQDTKTQESETKTDKSESSIETYDYEVPTDNKNSTDFKLGSVLKDLPKGFKYVEGMDGGRAGTIGQDEYTPANGFYVIDRSVEIQPDSIKTEYGLNGKDVNSNANLVHISYVAGAKTYEEALKIIEENKSNENYKEVEQKIQPRGWVSVKELTEKLQKQQRSIDDDLDDRER